MDQGEGEPTLLCLASWLEGVDSAKVTHLVHDVMGSHGFDMWARAGRAISDAYQRAGNPLKALEQFHPNVPVLHLYAQPADDGFFQAQKTFAENNLWFCTTLKCKIQLPYARGRLYRLEDHQRGTFLFQTATTHGMGAAP